MKTWKSALLCLAVVWASPSACGDGDGGSGGSETDEPDAQTCSEPAPSQGLSEACCPAHGVDACGAGLFCAAFDGRTESTCYAERSRLDQTECTADVQCMSGACNVTVAACRSLPGSACTPEVGCAPAPDASKYACDPASLQCFPMDPNDGGLCEQDADCFSQHCIESRCHSGDEGSPCQDADDCDSKICNGGACSAGGDGATCESDAQCTVGSCILGQCSTGQSGSSCLADDDCDNDAPYCAKGKCSSGWYGDACDDASDCDPDYPHCSGGACDDGTDLGQPCTTTSQCAKQQSELGKSVAVLCDSAKKTCVISHGGKCGTAWSQEICQTGYSCQPDEGNPGTCSVESTACTGSYCFGCVNDNCSSSWSCYDGWACL